MSGSVSLSLSHCALASISLRSGLILASCNRFMSLLIVLLNSESLWTAVSLLWLPSVLTLLAIWLAIVWFTHLAGLHLDRPQLMHLLTTLTHVHLKHLPLPMHGQHLGIFSFLSVFTWWNMYCPVTNDYWGSLKFTEDHSRMPFCMHVLMRITHIVILIENKIYIIE